MQVCICLCLSFMSSSNINIQIITCNLIINTWIQVKKIDSNAHLQIADFRLHNVIKVQECIKQ